MGLRGGAHRCDKHHHRRDPGPVHDKTCQGRSGIDEGSAKTGDNGNGKGDGSPLARKGGFRRFHEPGGLVYYRFDYVRNGLFQNGFDQKNGLSNAGRGG